MISGIMGLSPNDDSAGPLFVYHLYTQGKIKKQQFSILINHDFNKQSELTFGGVPRDWDLDGAVSHRVSGSFHWQMRLYDFKIGNDRVEL